jgi:hypothetical protein
MGNWDSYQREERPRLTPGDYRVEIVSVEEKESKKGNPMLVIGVRPNGSDIIIYHYIVKNEYFNRNMTDFFDSFNIDNGDFALPTQFACTVILGFASAALYHWRASFSPLVLLSSERSSSTVTPYILASFLWYFRAGRQSPSSQCVTQDKSTFSFFATCARVRLERSRSSFNAKSCALLSV